MQQQGIGERQGRTLDAFAGRGRADQCAQGIVDVAGQRLANAACAQAMLQVGTHVLHEGGGFACFWLQCLPLCGLQQGPYFTPVIHAAQLLAQHVAEGYGAVDHAHPHIGQVTTCLGGLHRCGKVDQALALARQVAAAQEQLAPEFTRLPVAVISGSVAKT